MITVDQLQGHWRRDWIAAPGFRDETTRVHWMQAGDLFADLRIPLDRPDITGKTCLADLDQAALAQLMQAEGFAGHITVAENRCTWKRVINWHGVPDADDIGLMSFEDEALYEDGVLATYRERWLYENDGPLRGHRIAGSWQTGILIENDAVFLLGLGPPPAGASEILIAALQAGNAPDAQISAHFDSLYCIGIWDGADGVASLCTNPFCEGDVILQRTAGGGFTCVAPSFDGKKRTLPLQVA